MTFSKPKHLVLGGTEQMAPWSPGRCKNPEAKCWFRRQISFLLHCYPALNKTCPQKNPFPGIPLWCNHRSLDGGSTLQTQDLILCICDFASRRRTPLWYQTLHSCLATLWMPLAMLGCSSFRAAMTMTFPSPSLHPTAQQPCGVWVLLQWCPVSLTELAFPILPAHPDPVAPGWRSQSTNLSVEAEEILGL